MFEQTKNIGNWSTYDNDFYEGENNQCTEDVKLVMCTKTSKGEKWKFSQ